MPTYPGSPVVSVDVLVKQPTLISRALTNLAAKRFVADKIFTRGTPDQVAGGSALFQKSESVYTDTTRSVEEVSVRSEWPRAGWTEAIFTAFVKQYGLEVPISDLAVRRNQLDQIERAQVKLANSVTKFVDTQAMTLLTTDAGVQTQAASGDWTTAATDIVADLANARKKIYDLDEGYEADTLVLNPAQELDLLIDADIRNALPRESQGPITTGRPIPILGLSQILVTPQLAAGTALVLNSKIVGTIADEAPDPRENYVAYRRQGGDSAPVYVKVYREENRDDNIIRAARFPAMWLGEPASAVKITGA